MASPADCVPAFISNIDPAKPIDITRFQRRVFRITPQSFPAVALSDPLNPFSPPKPRQRIKVGHLVSITASHRSLGSIPQGRWLAVVTQTKSQSTDALWHVRIVARTSNLGYWACKETTIDIHHGIEHTCAKVSIVNPWATVADHHSSYYPFSGLNTPTASQNFVNRSAHPGTSTVGMAYLIATNSASKVAAARLEGRIKAWMSQQGRYSDVFSSFGINPMKNLQRQSLETRSVRMSALRKHMEEARMAGRAFALLKSSLERLGDRCTTNDAQAASDCLNNSTSFFGFWGDIARQRARDFISQTYGWEPNQCGHFGAPRRVVADNYGSTCKICESCFESGRASQMYRRVLVPASWDCTDPDGYAWVNTRSVVLYNHATDDNPDWRAYPLPPAIGQYHSSRNQFNRPMPHITGKLPNSGPYVGFELEFMRDRSGTDINAQASRMRTLLKPFDDLVSKSGSGKYYALFEYDGSVDYEMVTGFGPLDIHRAAVIGMLGGGEFKGKLKSHDGGKCGLHVHIDKPDSAIHAARLVEFYNKGSNARLIKSVARRYDAGHRYAKVVPGKGGLKAATSGFSSAKRRLWEDMTPASWKAIVKPQTLRSLTDDRYELVNFQPEKTVEIRVFRGSMVPSTVIACLEFAYLSWFFARDCVTMDTEHFIAFISKPEWRHESKYLRDYLTKKGYAPWMPSKPQAMTVPDVGDEREAVSLPPLSEVKCGSIAGMTAAPSATIYHDVALASPTPTPTDGNYDLNRWYQWNPDGRGRHDRPACLDENDEVQVWLDEQTLAPSGLRQIRDADQWHWGNYTEGRRNGSDIIAWRQISRANAEV